MEAITKTFDGHAVTAIIYNGEPHWFAIEIGAALGYAVPRDIVAKISGEWADEFAEGDVVRLQGEELRAFKQHVATLAPCDHRAKSVTLLSEQGLYLVLMLSRTPAGKRVREWLKSEVLPAIRKTGTYLAPGAETQRELSPEMQRSYDLIVARLQPVMDHLQRQIAAWPAARRGVWESCHDIATRLGLNRSVVQAARDRLDLKQRHDMFRYEQITMVFTARWLDRPKRNRVEVKHYCPAAVTMIEADIASNMIEAVQQDIGAQRERIMAMLLGQHRLPQAH